MTPRHFLIDDDLSSAEIVHVLDEADRLKKDRFGPATSKDRDRLR